MLADRLLRASMMRALLLALSILLVMPQPAEAKKRRKRGGKAAHALKQKRKPAARVEAPMAEPPPAAPARAPARHESRPMVAQADDNEVPPHASGAASR